MDDLKEKEPIYKKWWFWLIIVVVILIAVGSQEQGIFISQSVEAKSYLNTMSFSYTGLIKQLKFEGFTAQQAEYGVLAVGY